MIIEMDLMKIKGESHLIYLFLSYLYIIEKHLTRARKKIVIYKMLEFKCKNNQK
jgi:hypothetical protein